MPTQTDLLKKVAKGFLHICGVEFDFDGQLVPSISAALQSFYDSSSPDANWVAAYFSKSALKFSEKSSTGKSGVSYQQTLSWSFPNNDTNRSIRIEEIHQVKYVKIVLSDGSRIVLGRNDFYQNTKPKVASVSDQNKTTITFNFISVFPYGYLEGLDQGGYFPVDIPITFINL